MVDYTISAVDRALRLLELLSEMPDRGVSELAEHSGATKSLTFRLLHTLEARGFVQKSPERRTYTLGHRAMLVGDQARRQSRLLAAAEPYMAELFERLQENILLLVRDGMDSICLSMRSSPDRERIYAEVGRRGPLHAGGGPKVLLAYAPAEVRRAVLAGDLPSYTDRTISDPQDLDRALTQIRRDGWTISTGELDFNKSSVAAPVLGEAGEVIAALSVTGPDERLRAELTASTRDAVVGAAHRLSVAMGFSGAPVMAS